MCCGKRERRLEYHRVVLYGYVHCRTEYLERVMVWLQGWCGKQGRDV